MDVDEDSGLNVNKLHWMRQRMGVWEYVFISSKFWGGGGVGGGAGPYALSTFYQFARFVV